MHFRRKSGIVAVLAVGLVTFGMVGNVAAVAATMRIVPSSDTVGKDATFTIRVVQNAPIAASGTQATVTFDQTKVQVQSVERGQAHKSSPVFLPSDLTGAISNANKTGKLKTIATAFLPPDSVPAGDQDFLIVTFSAIGCGKVDFGLPVGAVDAAMLDGTEAGYGNTLTVATSGASVTIDCSVAGSTAAAGASGSPSSGGSGAPGVAGSTSTSAPGENVAGATAGTGANAANAAIGGTNGPSSGSGGSLPLWLPLLLAIPALALIGYVLLKRPLQTRS